MDKRKILIIDDDLDLVASTKLFLESNNYEVYTSVNTKIGIETIKTVHPDLIILDVMMDTNLEGYNFLNEIKSDDKLMDIPIIVNTSMAKAIGVNLRASVEDVDNLPKTRFIDKSGDWDELLKTVKELL